MRRLLLPTAFVLLAIGVIAVAVVAWWQGRDTTLTRYTDGGTLQADLDDAPTRTVLWEPAVPIGAPVNTESDDEYEAAVNDRETTLIFVRGRPGANADLYETHRTPSGGWSEPVPIESLQSPYDELGPEVSGDGGHLYFYSDRPDGHGGYDVWRSELTSEGWGTPSNLGLNVNGPHHDYGPALTPDGQTLYFASNRPREGEPVRGGVDAWPATVRERRTRHDYDLYEVTLGDRGPGPALPVESVNTPDDEGAPAVSPAGDFLWFASDRAGGHGGYDLYRQRLVGPRATPENVGPAINTPGNELDPTLSYAGFKVRFSSDRAGTATEATPALYDLYVATSREVFLEDETLARSVDWASIVPMLWWLLLLALLLLLLWLLLMLMDVMQSRAMSLLAKCVVASLTAHALILLLLTFWGVGNALSNWAKAGTGTRVVLTTARTGDAIEQQVRGPATTLEITTPPVPDAEPQHDVPDATAAVVPEAALPEPARRVAETLPPAPSVAVPTLERPAPEAPPIPRTAIALDVPDVTATDARPPTPVPVTPLPTAAAVTPVAPSVEAAIAPAAIAVDPAPRDSSQMTAAALSAPVPLARPESVLTETPAPPSLTIETPHVPEAAHVADGDVPPVPSPVTPAARPVSTPPPPGGRREFLPVEVDVTPRRVAARAASPSAAQPSAALRNVTLPDPTSPPPDAAPAFAIATPAAVTPREPVRADTTTPDPPVPDVPQATPTHTTAAASPAALLPADVPPTPPMPRRISSTSVVTPTTPAAPARGLVDPEPVALATPSPLALALPARTTPDDARPVERPTTPTATPLPAHAQARVAVTPDQPAAPTRLDTTPLRTPVPRRQTQSTAPAVSIPLVRPAPPVTTPAPAPTRLALAVPRPSPPAFANRAEPERQEILEEMGGSAETEAAVARALDWLARHQSEDGRWDGRRFDRGCGACEGHARVQVDLALTGLSLLAFLAADHTPDRAGPYQDNVTRAVDWLTAQQSSDGGLMTGESMYSHGIATIALAEAYGMTGDRRLAGVVERAIQYIVDAAPREDRGWRYEPGQFGDTSVLGWQVMALVSADRAGLEVPTQGYDVAHAWLERVEDARRPGRYKYQPRHQATATMTAEALFARQLLDRGNPTEAESVTYILAHPPEWGDSPNTYYWYYATLAMFQHQGEAWTTWNDAIRDTLVDHQHTEGPLSGSWDPQDDRWASRVGRVYQTAMGALTLEIYYRYLPRFAEPE